MENIYHFTPNYWSIEGMRYKSLSGNMDVHSEISEVSIAVALMEGVIVMDGMEREDNILL